MLGGILACRGGVGRKLMVKLVERVDLHDIAAHNGAKGTQLFLVLAHLHAVCSLGLLDTLHKLSHFLAGRVELKVDGVVVGRKGLIVTLQGDYLVGEFLLFNIQLAHKRVLLDKHVSQGARQECGDGNHCVHNGFGTAVCLTLLLLALKPLKGIFSFHISNN